MNGADMQIIWDLDDDPEGNLRHIVDGHDVTVQEVEVVLRGHSHPYVVSRRSGHRIAYGETTTGRAVAVVWQCVGENPLAVYPITAWPID